MGLNPKQYLVACDVIGCDIIGYGELERLVHGGWRSRILRDGKISVEVVQPFTIGQACLCPDCALEPERVRSMVRE